MSAAKPDPLKERDLYRECLWCGRINCHKPHEGKTCRCRICGGEPTTEQLMKALRHARRALKALGDVSVRKHIREILGDWR